MKLRIIVAAALAALVLAACGDDPQPAATTAPPTVAPTTPTTPSPTPTGPVDIDSGQATFEVSGDENATIDVQIDPNGFDQYDPEDGEFSATFRGGDDALLRMTLTFDEAGALTDAFIAIGLGGQLAGDENYYYDAFHTQCDVTTEPFDGLTVSGSFTCDDLPEDDGATIDASGTFTATAA